MCLSKLRLAASCFNLVFSSRSWRSSRTSLTPVPPYFFSSCHRSLRSLPSSDRFPRLFRHLPPASMHKLSAPDYIGSSSFFWGFLCLGYPKIIKLSITAVLRGQRQFKTPPIPRSCSILKGDVGREWISLAPVRPDPGKA